MHVALMVDEEWLEEEHESYRLLVAGLLDEAVAVAQVLPEGCDELAGAPLGEFAAFPQSDWSWITRWRIMEHAARLQRSGVELVHALSPALWDPALRLGARMGVPVVLGCDDASDLPVSSAVRRAAATGAAAFSAPSGPVAQGVIEKLRVEATVRCIPTGVMLGAEREAGWEPGQALCVVVSGDGEMTQEYESFLLGVRGLVNEVAACQFFFESTEDQHSIWPVIKRLELQSQVSLLPRSLGQRDLLLGGHALVHPHALGRTRSLTLRAMASGVPVIARQDPWVEHLVDEATAWIVEEANPEHWATLLRRLVEDPARSRGLGRSARQWVATHRRASDYVARTLSLYHELLGVGMRFPGAGLAS